VLPALAEQQSIKKLQANFSQALYEKSSVDPALPHYRNELKKYWKIFIRLCRNIKNAIIRQKF
jgi:hypothetical protein